MQPVEMHPVDWKTIEEYVANGNLMRVAIGKHMDTLEIDVLYACTARPGSTSTADISLLCQNCGYIDLRRTDSHEPDSAGVIFEAYLRTESKLINALHSHQLDSIAGCLHLEHDKKQVYHLEIIGEVSLNVLCEDLTAKWSTIRHE